MRRAAATDARVVTGHYRPVTYIPQAVGNPASPQQAPLTWRPEWRVEHLVYQGGVPLLPPAPPNGGGFFPFRNPPRGMEQPFWQPYITPAVSMVGSGSLPSRPNFLTRLLGGFFTRNQP